MLSWPVPVGVVITLCVSQVHATWAVKLARVQSLSGPLPSVTVSHSAC